MEQVEIEVDGLKLRGKLYRTQGAQKSIAVLFLHGWTGHTNEDAAALLAQNRYCAMTISLSGHNDSDGSIEQQTRTKSLKEAIAAFDYFKSQLPKGIKISVAANSYGAYMAAIMSSERPIYSLQLRVPALYSDDHWDEPQIKLSGDNLETRKWRDAPRNYSESRALKAVNQFQGPIQIIEAENDERLSHQVVQNYLDAISDKDNLDYHFMKGWPHSLADDAERDKQYEDILLNWLNKQL